MKRITKKSDVKTLLGQCLNAYQKSGLTALISNVHQLLLMHKVKFPLLEFCAHTIYETLPSDEQIDFCDHIAQLKTEGGNVILGILLQRRLESHFQQSILKAKEYIILGEIWYVCDIIGERVFGYALLTQPDRTLPVIKKASTHPSHWVVRSLGAGAHYAIKKGLDKTFVKSLFALLLTMASTTNKEIKQGVGWAAKTTAKFYPDIIDHFQNQIHDTTHVAQWFRNKIEIGLNRNRYAKRN